MLSKDERTQLIIDYVTRLDAKWGRPGSSLRDNAKPFRVITDSPIWSAEVTPDHEKDEDGNPLSLIMLWFRGEHRLTGVFAPGKATARLYRPGTWETEFTHFPSGDTEPLLP